MRRRIDGLRSGMRRLVLRRGMGRVGNLGGELRLWKRRGKGEGLEVSSQGGGGNV